MQLKLKANQVNKCIKDKLQKTYTLHSKNSAAAVKFEEDNFKENFLKNIKIRHFL